MAGKPPCYDGNPTMCSLRINYGGSEPDRGKRSIPCGRTLFLEWNEPEPNASEPIDEPIDEPEPSSVEPNTNEPIDEPTFEPDIEDDIIVDLDNVHDEPDIEVTLFEISKSVGYGFHIPLEENTVIEDDLDVLDNDDFESQSGSDGDIRKRKLKQLRKEKNKLDASMYKHLFYVGQQFGSSTEVKERIKLHSIESRRELHLIRNDKQRVRVVCRGKTSIFGPTGPPKEFGPKNGHESGGQDKIVEQVKGNPDIPVRAVKEQLEKKFELGVSLMKAFRAKSEADKQIRGDYKLQYTLLRDYILELQTTNPGTTVRVEVQSGTDPHSPTRIFKRIYVCLGSLKQGFKACQRDFLGVDGAFMKGPFPGQILSAVGVDGNNGIYPVVYSIVEAENISSWTWFLDCLGEDLGLQRDSNFTFISDRQKGVLPALAKVFPKAEHRYCLLHIHGNMKKSWNGKAYKDHLWRCATATTVQHFNKAMDKLKAFDAAAHQWLSKIPPCHWSRSHFSGQSHTDILLNNMCEVYNGKIVGGRDKPIITCLEYIREYCIRRIVNVTTVIEKCIGPLTPTATTMLDNIKKEAAEYIVLFNGDHKYQVSGPWNDQCVVDSVKRTCTCRRWEITGLPCKHVVAVNWNMVINKVQTGVVESWAHPCYWLETWKQVYSYKVQPINGSNMWFKSEIPTTLKHPTHHKQVGRPKKKRCRAPDEKDPIVKDGKLSRAWRSVICSKCGNTGHNKKSCLGQGTTSGNGTQAGGNGTQATGNGTQATNATGSEAAARGTQASGSQTPKWTKGKIRAAVSPS